jgi:hypothetical protein
VSTAPAGAIVAVVGLFAAWGLQAGLSEGAEKALVAAGAPEAVRGAAFGTYHMVAGMMALPASLLFGWLWEGPGPAVAFGAGASCAAVATLLLSRLR